jgi:hypothetical protein
MAMQHYAEVKTETPRAIKEVKKTSMSSLLQQYVTEVEQDINTETLVKKELISEQARQIAERIRLKETDKWIQKANVKKGGLHKALGVPQDETIPKSKIEKASHSKNAHLKHMAQFAKNVSEAHDPHEYGYEGEMAENQFTALKHAMHEIESMLSRDTDLPEWVQSKITLATDYVETVRDYLIGERGMAESHNPDTMSPADYDRHEQDQMDNDKRSFKRREMEHELSHEDNGQYYIVIAKNGKWEKTKAQPDLGMDAAFKMVERLHNKYPSMHLGVYDPFMKSVHNMGKKA